MKEIHAKIHGRVQGVTYRATTRRRAKDLGIVGFVRNNPDGTVEVLAQGTEEKLNDFIDYLHEGPQLARVKDADIEWREPTEEFDEFRVQY